jgi:acetyl esterase/lipase
VPLKPAEGAASATAVLCESCGGASLGRERRSTTFDTAKIAIAGAMAASLIVSWRQHLSLKMNLLGWVYDRLELFPNSANVRTESESLALLRRHRLNWKVAEFLPQFEGPAMAKTFDVAVPSREEGRTIPCRVYKPKARGILPVVLFIHGGGYSFGSVRVYDSLVRDLASQSRCVFVSVDYRLSPEHKFPAGLEDSEDVLRWIAGSPKDLTQHAGANPGRLAVCGDSAGGNFAASVAVFAKSAGIQLLLQCLIYPNTSMFSIPHWRSPSVPLARDSAVRYSGGPMLNYSSLVWGTSGFAYLAQRLSFGN